MPEMPQVELNRCMGILYASRITSQGGPVAERAKFSLDAMMSRKKEAELGLGTSSVADVADMLLSARNPDEFRAILARLKNVRLLPLDRMISRTDDLEFNRFPQILAY